MAKPRKRGNRWYIEVRERGYYESSTHRTKRQAEIWRDQVLRDLDENRPRGAHTLTEAMRRYANEVSSGKGGWRREQIMFARFERDMPYASDPIDAIRPAQIADWRDRRLTEIKPSSVRRELVALTSCMEHVRREWGWLSTNPCRDVKKPSAGHSRNQTISDAQRDALFEYAGYRRGVPPITQRQLICAALDLALETAMRAGEIRGLKGPHIHLAERYVHLPTSKTGRARDVPLSKKAVAILESLDCNEPFSISGSQLDANFRKLKRLCGLQGEFTFHDSRATAITRLARKLPIEALARVSGHTDMRSLQGYYREHASNLATMLDD